MVFKAVVESYGAETTVSFLPRGRKNLAHRDDFVVSGKISDLSFKFLERTGVNAPFFGVGVAHIVIIHDNVFTQHVQIIFSIKSTLRLKESPSRKGMYFLATLSRAASSSEGSAR